MTYKRQPRGFACSVDGCMRPVIARTWCVNHYNRWRKNGDPMGILQVAAGRTCSTTDCLQPAYSRGWCRTHYGRWYVHGDPTIFKKLYRKRCQTEGCEREHDKLGYCGPTNGSGYRIVAKDPSNHRRKEHRVRMEQLLGRPLRKEENVHHVNGQRADNTVTGELDENFRSGNLELWSTSQPSGQRVVDKLAWAHGIIELYGHLTDDPQISFEAAG